MAPVQRSASLASVPSHVEYTLNSLAGLALRAAEDLDDVARDADPSVTSHNQTGLDSWGTIPTQETT